MTRTTPTRERKTHADPVLAPTARSVCPVCGVGQTAVFWRMAGLPVRCNVLCRTRAEALAVPRGDIELAVCESCGFIWNVAFDPARMTYDAAYENSLHFSPRFQQYAEGLADRLIDRYDLHGKDIIEIACGQGDFLGLLCERGGNRGVGFDPGYREAHSGGGPVDNGSLRFVPDYYDERYANVKADFICCRHALEHIPEPVAFLRTVRRAIGENGTAVFFEVPNVMYTLRDLGIWDIIYEHCCYFSAASLARCFTAAGFAIERVDETYDGQFLTIEARPACGKPESGLHGRGRAAESEVGCRCASSSTAEAEASASGRPNGPSEVPSPGGASAEAVMQAARTFRTRFDEKLSTWQRQFGEFAATGQRAVIWGAGSKGVTILNMLKVTAGLEPVEYVVDINPRKQGRFAAGTGQQIVSPSFLRDYGPDIVVVMNAVYVDEIRTLVHKLGLDPALWKV